MEPDLAWSMGPWIPQSQVLNPDPWLAQSSTAARGSTPGDVDGFARSAGCTDLAPRTSTPGAFAGMAEDVDGFASSAGWTEPRPWARALPAGWADCRALPAGWTDSEPLPELEDVDNSPGWHRGLQPRSYYSLDPRSRPWDVPGTHPCPDCGLKACAWRKAFKGHEFNPREGPCSTSTLISVRLDGFPHWHSQEVKIYFLDSIGTCNSYTGANTIIVRADAFGRMCFHSPLHCCMGQPCEGEKVCVLMECPPDSDNLVQLSTFTYAGLANSRTSSSISSRRLSDFDSE